MTDAGKARGVLRTDLGEGSFVHERHLPPEHLRPLIEHFWYVAWDLRDLPPQQQATLPHPNVHLVVEPPQARIYGVHSGRFECELSGQGRTFGIKFKPAGFHPFYGKALSTLADQSIALADVFGADGEAYERDVLAAPGLTQMESLATTLLETHWPSPDATVDRVNTLIASIIDDRSITTVEHVCERTGMTARGLQRLFREYIGVGPKWVINRYRLHEALAQLQEGREVSWAALAQELGYFDQAHFIRDFRKLVGVAPGAYVKGLKA
ncbi:MULTISPECIES: helix-turn-helix domain-containing protein [Dyella]|uniref:AraC family transcriptional regulator n=2 Tax=Dyella TaxID=231454 RepID=A0A4R0YJ80_9GAMM|nr:MULTISPECIES: helix-turn-helix domain-containing protein [Dyella]TBR35974.1 AraC family transcriptional regulator [Dyella terrae]TCI08479.1 AraC family transcriptional regulator [Dyella soli]